VPDAGRSTVTAWQHTARDVHTCHCEHRHAVLTGPGSCLAGARWPPVAHGWATPDRREPRKGPGNEQWAPGRRRRGRRLGGPQVV